MCWAMLSVSGDLNYEKDVEHAIMVRVTDSTGRGLTRRFMVTIVDVNDAPHVR